MIASFSDSVLFFVPCAGVKRSKGASVAIRGVASSSSDVVRPDIWSEIVEPDTRLKSDTTRVCVQKILSDTKLCYCKGCTITLTEVKWSLILSSSIQIILTGRFFFQCLQALATSGSRYWCEALLRWCVWTKWCEAALKKPKFWKRFFFQCQNKKAYIFQSQNHRKVLATIKFQQRSTNRYDFWNSRAPNCTSPLEVALKYAQ